MWLLRWLTQNWADTDVPSPPDLKPLELPLSPPEARERIGRAVAVLPRWRVEADAPTDPLHLTRRTPLWGFTDDITLRLEPTPTGTRVHARSKSRVGVGDFGQNHRNILELFGALAQSEGPSA
jgi:uncharacterized protein (DUF1499 family)